MKHLKISHHFRDAPSRLVPFTVSRYDEFCPVPHEAAGDGVHVHHAVGRVAHEYVHNGPDEENFDDTEGTTANGRSAQPFFF